MSISNQISLSETKSTNLQQEAFIKKIKGIKLLQEEFKILSEKIPAAVMSFQMAVNKYAPEIKELEIKRLKSFDKYFDQVKYTKNQQKDIADFMVESIFEFLIEDDSEIELKTIFEKYAKIPFEEFLANQNEEINLG